MAKGAAMKKAAANKAMTKGSIADSLANSLELVGRAWSSRSEEDRHLHYPRTRQNQDAQKASQDCRQGICSGRTQSSDLMTLLQPLFSCERLRGKVYGNLHSFSTQA